MATHRATSDDSFRSIAELYYQTAEASSALAQANGTPEANAPRANGDVKLPARLIGYAGLSERAEMKTVVETKLFERRKDLVFVKVQENVYPGRPADLVSISGKWLYVVCDGAIVVRAEAVSAVDWDVDNQVFGGRRTVGDSTVTLIVGKDYSFYLAPLALTPSAEDYLVEHIAECITVSHLKAPEGEVSTFVRDAYLWALDLHRELYVPKLTAWQSWIADEERAAKLFIASALKCMIDQVDPGWIYDGTDPLSLRNELQAGEPERFIEQVYSREELKQRTEAERAMALLAETIESFDFRTIERSAMDEGKDALALSVVVYAGVLACVAETQPGRALAQRLVSDQTRIPLSYVFTDTPPANSSYFAEFRYLCNAALAMIKDLAPAWVKLHAKPGFDSLKHIQGYLERISGERPELLRGTYPQVHQNLTAGRPLTRKLKAPQKVRDKLVRKSGLAAAESAANEAAKPPPTLARCARLSEAYVEAFETAHTSYRLVLETVNLSNAMGAAKADLTGRKLMSAVGAIADFGALLSEALEVFARESRKKTLKVSAAGLGFVSGICDCFDFAMSTGEAAGKHDYNQAVGLAVATVGAGTIAVGSWLGLSAALGAGASAAAAGASVGGVVGAAMSGAATGTVLGIIGAALVGGGTLAARLCLDSSYEEFAQLSFLGKEHDGVIPPLAWTPIRLPAKQSKDEFAALLHLISSFQVAIEDDSGVSVYPGFYRDVDRFEVYLETRYEDRATVSATIEVDPKSGEIVQLSGSERLADSSFVLLDETGRAEKIWISQRLAAAGSHEMLRMIDERMARVRLRQAPSAFVPPKVEGTKSDWVQAEFAIGRFGPDRRKGHSSQPSDRADLRVRPSILTKPI
ncbi:MAG: hypothetical protein RLZZ450_1515 [Pseudomonadota bacterium]|jgi:hypothetical protein